MLPVTVILFPSMSEMITISSSLQEIFVSLRSVSPFTVSLVVVIFRPRWSVLLRYSMFPSGGEKFQQKSEGRKRIFTFIIGELDDSKLYVMISEQFDGPGGCPVRQQFGLHFPRD